MSRWPRATLWARRLWDLVPFTAATVVVGSLSFVAVRTYGLGKQDLLLLVIGGVGLVVTGLANVGVALVALRVAWSARRHPPGEPVEIECGRGFSTGFRLSDPWFPFTDVTWTWDSPVVQLQRVPDGWGRSEKIVAYGRGEWRAITRRFVVSDAFGLARIAFSVTENRTLRALPSTGEIRAVPLSQALGQGEDLSDPLGAARGDLFDMRPYAPGDPIRHVLWKVFARTREVVVRVPERALAPLPQTVAFLVGGDEAPAGAARVAIEGGLFGGDFRFGADGLPGAVEDPTAAIDRVVKSGIVDEGTHGTGLAPFLDSARGMRRAMVFTPARPGPWLDQAIAACGVFGADGLVQFVVCTDGVSRSSRPGRLERWVLAPASADPGPSAVAAEELQQVVRALGQAGGKVIVVDRATGAVS